MIAPLRAWHRRWWLLLAVALPVLILLALSARQPVPPVDELPALRQAGQAQPEDVRP